MGYTEYFLIIDGVGDESVCVDDDDKVIHATDGQPATGEQWLLGIQDDYADQAAELPVFAIMPYPWEVYRIHHDHEFGPECECVQYLTDHRPIWSSEGESDGETDAN